MRLVADQNFNDHIIRGLLRRLPGLDVARVRDVGLARAPDPELLEWAAREGRIRLTHDRRTMAPDADQRTTRGLRMPGVVAVPGRMPGGRAVDELATFVERSLDGEWEGQVIYLPL